MGESIGMTARVGGTVQRTLSDAGGERTGLPGAETHEASGEDFGNFPERFVGLRQFAINSHRCKLNQNWLLSSGSHGGVRRERSVCMRNEIKRKPFL
jgi:hypothetical protein